MSNESFCARTVIGRRVTALAMGKNRNEAKKDMVGRRQGRVAGERISSQDPLRMENKRMRWQKKSKNMQPAATTYLDNGRLAVALRARAKIEIGLRLDKLVDDIQSKTSSSEMNIQSR